MKNSEEKWIEEVFQSMQGSQRAKPRPELFARIEDQINQPQSKIVSFQQWIYVAAAVVLLLLANLTTLNYYTQSDQINEETYVFNDMYSQSLITSYQIYGE